MATGKGRKNLGPPPGTRKEILDYCEHLAELRRFDETEVLLSELLDADPNDGEAIFRYGYCQSERWNNGLAVALYKHALTFAKPGNIGPLVNMGVAYSRLWRFDEALEVLHQADSIQPNDSLVLLNLAHAYLWSGRAEIALEYLDRFIEMEPGSIAGYDNKAIALLYLGRFAEGWDHYEQSLGYKYRKEFAYGDEPRWQGEKGQNLIVFGEQGLGDEIIFSSCLHEAMRHANRVIVDTQPKLRGLFQRSFPSAKVLATRWESAIKLDEDIRITARAAFGTLPRFYRRKREYFSGKPYLTACPERRAMYRGLLDSLGPGLKVGLAWRGGETRTGAHVRSLELKQMEPLYTQEGAHFVDLDYMAYCEEQKQNPYIHHWPWATQTEDYDDTAALVAELDLVISVCTSVVHLAGALGVECWCLVPAETNWRFSSAAENPDGTYLWHKSVHIIRQTERLQWTPVIEKVRRKLRARIEADIHRDGSAPAGCRHGADVEPHPAQSETFVDYAHHL